MRRLIIIADRWETMTQAEKYWLAFRIFVMTTPGLHLALQIGVLIIILFLFARGLGLIP